MYPPRSSRKRSNTTRKQRKNRIWSWINISLLALITVMLFYFFYSGAGRDSIPIPETGTASPSPEGSAAPGTAGAADPVASGGASAAPSGELQPTFSADAVPSAEAVPTPSPAASEGSMTAPSGASQQASGAGADGAEGNGPSAGLPEGEEGSGKTVTLNFAGDVIFAGKVGELLKQKGYDYPYARLGGMFLQDDLSVINLETPVTERGTEANKTFVFKSPPEALNALKAAGVDAVNLANNHTLDMGEQGLRDTMANLDQRGIPFVGAGVDSAQAYSAQYFTRKGITIALLGFTRVMPEAGWAAGKGKPGVASAYDSGPALKAIAEARKKADIVAVVVHWGQERADQPNAVQQTLGRSFIDAGADLVIGGHPHVLQGLEPYKGKWIAYSTGNFIFTRSSTKTTWETAVFQAECSVKGQCSMKLTPFEAELGQPVPMSAADGQKLLQRVESLSSGKVEIDEEGRVTEAGR
ncbi:poly-gamma-glutamate synthesis protein (capsule biosynthesis protein) [Paenibacillus sophorae]|uniref:CapA family protein n=1 Tax=Paenibacillus sophorae TaxID=1333845 RepID=A0A1H8TUS0_9BACL|nr:CapA family protein [Paenibacillus sophorae]QWU18044.1 CapA family protein [Paenibacillus sophorae]SEO94667.1 poly-gamma-glutamate synthesis protein (capsule biosynthesis protein) [Paenibacillus sophorae]